ARMGCRVAVITLNIERTAHMPCNCSIGGPAKGHLVREIDALGGQMGINTDRTLTHIRFVGTGKGPAVRTLRAHADKALYPAEMLRTLQAQKNLTLIEGSVEGLIARDGVCVGVEFRRRDADATQVTAHAVVITTGTFLNGLCHIGEQKIRAARYGDPPAVGLTESLRQLGFRMGRFKTGTTPRISKKSV
ncbi:MAG: FAD-dependent oxidoreductase, partial [Anaerolineae bacterium]|nr:FAD-dependent oxidoreductase [Anaerolineae bacterium]